MFEGWSQWTWVLVAWGELALAYALYALYLRRREVRARRAEGEDAT